VPLKVIYADAERIRRIFGLSKKQPTSLKIRRRA